MTALRLVFMGSPEFSVPVLAALIDAGHDVVAVYSQPPRPAGRGQKERRCAVHDYAASRGIPVYTPATFKEDGAVEQFQKLNADAAVVVAYGLILPKSILDAPKLGCINVHASLLPRWRGAAPIHRAILAGDDKTGVCIMQMDEGLDTGPVLLREAVSVSRQTTVSELHDQLSNLGAKLITPALDRLAAGNLVPETQTEEGVTYAHKLEKSEGLLDWTDSAETLERKIRAFVPWPGVWFELKGERIKVLSAEIVDPDGKNDVPGTVLDDQFTIACGTGSLRPTCLQRAGKQKRDLAEFLRGYPVEKGLRL